MKSETVVNPATGEVSVELGGVQFRLRATMQRVGELEATLGVDGLPGVQQKLTHKSAGATLAALKCLCVSENEDLLDDLPYGEILPAIEAVWKALAAGLPDPKKARAVTSRANGQPRGRAIEPSHSAS